MNLQQWLGDLSKQAFVRDYYHKLPFSRQAGATSVCPLGQWEVLAPIATDPQADVMIVRQGERYTGPVPEGAEQLQALNEQGYTVLVRHAERHHEQLAALAAELAEELNGQVNVHMYATPAEQFGFGWHYDAEEVFILQTTGTKHYQLRKNTVHPWPLVESIPADMRYEREIMPLMRCTLSAGDWLYIPAGYWHMAQAQSPAISLAVGVMSPSAVDVLDYLRQQLPQSILWRQRLPTLGAATAWSDEELVAHYREVLQQLADDLGRQLTSDTFLNDLLQHLRRAGP